MFKKYHNYCIEVPISVEDALQLDKQRKDIHWRDALRTEMKNVMIACDILGEGEELTPRLEELRVNLVLDIQKDLSMKARLVTDRHLTQDPGECFTYATAVSCKTIHIPFNSVSIILDPSYPDIEV